MILLSHIEDSFDNDVDESFKVVDTNSSNSTYHLTCHSKYKNKYWLRASIIFKLFSNLFDKELTTLIFRVHDILLVFITTNTYFNFTRIYSLILWKSSLFIKTVCLVPRFVLCIVTAISLILYVCETELTITSIFSYMM